MSIQNRNNHSLYIHRSSHLNHFNHYHKMQDTIEEATLSINTTIRKQMKYTHPNWHRKSYATDIDTSALNMANYLRRSAQQELLLSWTQTMKTIFNKNMQKKSQSHTLPSPHPWASYQIRKIAGCAWAENAGKVSPPLTSTETAS